MKQWTPYRKLCLNKSYAYSLAQANLIYGKMNENLLLNFLTRFNPTNNSKFGIKFQAKKNFFLVSTIFFASQDHLFSDLYSTSMRSLLYCTIYSKWSSTYSHFWPTSDRFEKDKRSRHLQLAADRIQKHFSMQQNITAVSSYQIKKCLDRYF